MIFHWTNVATSFYTRPSNTLAKYHAVTNGQVQNLTQCGIHSVYCIRKIGVSMVGVPLTYNVIESI
jgi:hypothetical protein